MMTFRLSPTPEAQASRLREAEEEILRRVKVLQAVVSVVEGHGHAIPGAVPLASLRASDAIREWLGMVVSEISDEQVAKIGVTL
jgi:L-fucose isomerase-like protein